MKRSALVACSYLFTGANSAGNSAINQTLFGAETFLNLDGHVMVQDLTTPGSTLTLRTGGLASGIAKARLTDAGTVTSFGDAPNIAMGSAANVATGVSATVSGEERSVSIVC